MANEDLAADLPTLNLMRTIYRADPEYQGLAKRYMAAETVSIFAIAVAEARFDVQIEVEYGPDLEARARERLHAIFAKLAEVSGHWATASPGATSFLPQSTPGAPSGSS